MELTTGLLTILLAMTFNYFFFRLGKTFEYPDILKQPGTVVLEKFHTNKEPILRTWYGFLFSAVAFGPVVVLLYYSFLSNEHTVLLGLATISGILATIFQTLGLSRWVFSVPSLSDSYAEATSETKRETIEIIFANQNKFLGEGIGEHLGYFFTSLWTILLAIFLLMTDQQNVLLCIAGIIAGIAIAIGMLEAAGQKWAGAVVAIGYVVWSVYLVALGIQLII